MIEMNSEIIYYCDNLEIVNKIIILIDNPEVFNEKYKITNHDVVIQNKNLPAKKCENFVCKETPG